MLSWKMLTCFCFHFAPLINLICFFSFFILPFLFIFPLNISLISSPFSLSQPPGHRLQNLAAFCPSTNRWTLCSEAEVQSYQWRVRPGPQWHDFLVNDLSAPSPSLSPLTGSMILLHLNFLWCIPVPWNYLANNIYGSLPSPLPCVNKIETVCFLLCCLFFTSLVCVVFSKLLNVNLNMQVILQLEKLSWFWLTTGILQCCWQTDSFSVYTNLTTSLTCIISLEMIEERICTSVVI